MKYRIDPKSGNKLSALGFGGMRFPRGLNAKIDIDKSEKLVMSAIDRGVNYFDTGYVYAGSEQALGEILRRNNGAREKIFIATKLPHGQCKKYDDFDKFFNTQLKRLNTDHIDYYLMHNMSSATDWEKVQKLGIEQWLSEKKAGGHIRQVGFSFHGVQDEFMALLDMYDWDFCMIQYNYMNENYQAGRKGLQKAHEKGLPVMIMEALLGGKLAVGLPKKAEKLFADADRKMKPAEWALRWLWNHKEATVVLSGMNSMMQLDENIMAAESFEAGMVTDSETAVIAQVVEVFKESYKIPCTECNYCLPCPAQVNIPGSFTAYNFSFTSGFIAGMTLYATGIGATNPDRNFSARNCIKCGQCEKQCPQNIEIIKQFGKVTSRMEPFWFRVAMRVVRMLMK